jgi:hypothetical protein
MTVLVQLMKPGVWNVWAEDDLNVVQAVVRSETEPAPRIVQRRIGNRDVSLLVDADGNELARSGKEPT